MNTFMNIKIKGMGMYVPPNKVSSDILDEKLGLTRGYSLKYSGVRERYHVTDDCVGSLSAKALLIALADADVFLNDIDLLICSGVSFDYILPNRAARVLAELPNGSQCNIPAIDINNSCLSFVTGFEVAGHLLQSNQYNKIAIIASEISSKHLDPNNKEVATLFGDAAVAVIVEKSDNHESYIIKSLTQSFSEGADFSMIKGGGIKHPVKDAPYSPDMYSFQMKGRNLLKLAHRKIPVFLKVFFKDTDIAPEDIDVVIPHQASKMGLIMLAKIMPFRQGQLYLNLERYGNCISASIPLALYEAIKEKRLKRGNLCLLVGTAAGFAIGAVLFKY